MNLSYPLITIFIPTYNGRKWISQTIESVLNQTYQDFILIVSDDVSTDDTLDIVKKFNDKRISIRRNDKNLNIHHSSTLIHNCNTKYFKMLMQDDILMPECIKKQIDILEKNSQVGLTSSPFCIIFGDKKTKIKINNHREGIYNEPYKLMRRLLLSGNWIGSPSQVTIRTDAIRNKPIQWDYDFLGELTWYYYIFSNGYTYYHIKQPLSYYRIHQSMKTLYLKSDIPQEYYDFIGKVGSLCNIDNTQLTRIRIQYNNIIRDIEKAASNVILKLIK